MTLFDDQRFIVDGTIVCWGGDILGEKMMPSHMTSCPPFIEVASIAMNGENHVAGTVSGDRWLLCCGVVKELLDSLHCRLHQFGLLSCEGTDWHRKCAIHPPLVPIEFARDLLNIFFLIFANVFGKLLLCTIFRFKIGLG